MAFFGILKHQKALFYAAQQAHSLHVARGSHLDTHFPCLFALLRSGTYPRFCPFALMALGTYPLIFAFVGTYRPVLHLLLLSNISSYLIPIFLKAFLANTAGELTFVWRIHDRLGLSFHWLLLALKLSTIGIQNASFTLLFFSIFLIR